MPEGGFYQARRTSPTSLALVVLIHGAAVTALMMSKMEFKVVGPKPPIDVTLIPVPKDPPPVPEPETPEIKVRQTTQVDRVPPVIDVQRPADVTFDHQPDLTVVFDPGPSGDSLSKPVDPTLPPPPLPEPVRTEAQIDPRSTLQPDYPPSEQRAEREGRVTVRLVIGSDGRVKAVEKVRAASDDFYRVTERHARLHWRFKPATLDGKPVESRKTMTVVFRLDG